MAKKTKAGGKVKAKVPAKPAPVAPAVPAGGSNPAGGARYNTKFMDHKNNDGKFKPLRIEKKRG